MIKSTDLRENTIYQEGRKLYRVISYAHQKIARGGGKVIVKVRDLESGAILRKTYPSEYKADDVYLTTAKAQFLYKERENLVFMNNTSFEQFDVEKSMLGEQARFLKEGLEVKLRLFKKKIVDVELPIKVVYTVKNAPPDIRGNTAQGIVKEVELENDLKVRVPMFIKKGDEVRIDTRSGKYIERV